jgi:hypothetical protein
MAIASQIPHFWQDKEGKSHRNMLQVEVEDAHIANNYPKDGSITIRLQDETAQKAFKMQPQEALFLAEELKAIAKDQMGKKRDLWAQKAHGP